MKKLILSAFITCMIVQLQAQDTEFPKEWEVQLKLTNGMVTNFKGYAPDMYTGALGLAPQYAVIPHKLRIGAAAMLLYNNKKFGGLFGPSAAFKLKSIGTQLFGVGNIHLQLEHLWGTDQQRLLGGGPFVELGHKLLIGITAHRDYHLNSWWFQSAIGIKLNKTKAKDRQEFNGPRG
jgi:hypothetical protein